MTACSTPRVVKDTDMDESVKEEFIKRLAMELSPARQALLEQMQGWKMVTSKKARLNNGNGSRSSVRRDGGEQGEQSEQSAEQPAESSTHQEAQLPGQKGWTS